MVNKNQLAVQHSYHTLHFLLTSSILIDSTTVILLMTRGGFKGFNAAVNETETDISQKKHPRE